MAEFAEIILDGKTYQLPVITGSENEKAVDISKLRDQSGYITMDPGYKNTGATQSAITFLDGELGILNYRGYPIDQLLRKERLRGFRGVPHVEVERLPIDRIDREGLRSEVRHAFELGPCRVRDLPYTCFVESALVPEPNQDSNHVGLLLL